MKHLKDFKLYETASTEKYIYLLLDRSHYDSFDRRVKKFGTVDEVYIFRIVNNIVVGHINTALYQASRFSYLTDLSRSLSRTDNRISMDKVDIMIKFAKRNVGCIVKEFNTLLELKTSLEIDKHTVNYNEVRETVDDIKNFIKALRVSKLGERKYRYANHLLINSEGGYSTDRYMVINSLNEVDFRFSFDSVGPINVDTDVDKYYNARGFLTGNYNERYDIYSINKSQQNILKSMVIDSRNIYLDFSKKLNHSLKNPK